MRSLSLLLLVAAAAFAVEEITDNGYAIPEYDPLPSDGEPVEIPETPDWQPTDREMDGSDGGPSPQLIISPTLEQYEEFMAMWKALHPAPGPVPSISMLIAVLGAFGVPHPPGTPAPKTPEELYESLIGVLDNGCKKRAADAVLRAAAAARQSAVVPHPPATPAPQQKASRQARGNGNQGKRNTQSNAAQANRYRPYSVPPRPFLPPMNPAPFWAPPNNLQFHPMFDTRPVAEWITKKSPAELIDHLKVSLNNAVIQAQRNQPSLNNPVQVPQISSSFQNQAINLAPLPLAQAMQHAYQMQLEAAKGPSSTAFLPYGLGLQQPLAPFPSMHGFPTSFMTNLTATSQGGQMLPFAPNGIGYPFQIKKEEN